LAGTAVAGSPEVSASAPGLSGSPAASAGKPVVSAPSLPVPPTATATAAPIEDPDMMRPSTAAERMPLDPDFELSATFDVPAFLRRQEG
jgi:hypothetical protein